VSSSTIKTRHLSDDGDGSSFVRDAGVARDVGVGDEDGESGPVVHCTLDGEIAAELATHPPPDRTIEADPFRPVAPRVVDLITVRKRSVMVFRRDADASVGDVEARGQNRAGSRLQRLSVYVGAFAECLYHTADCIG
jgi:hypothetical protein